MPGGHLARMDICRTGWVYDYSAGKWYYVDENAGVKTGWYLDPQDDEMVLSGSDHRRDAEQDWQWIADSGLHVLESICPAADMDLR